MKFESLRFAFISKEIVVNLGLVPFIDMYSDSDAINQLIITMVRTEEETFIG